jgi:hypothetical protein
MDKEDHQYRVWLKPLASVADEPYTNNPISVELLEALESTYATFVRRHAGEFAFGDVMAPLLVFTGFAFGQMYQFKPWGISDDMSWEDFREATVKTFTDYLDKSQGRGRLASAP